MTEISGINNLTKAEFATAREVTTFTNDGTKESVWVIKEDDGKTIRKLTAEEYNVYKEMFAEEKPQIIDKKIEETNAAMEAKDSAVEAKVKAESKADIEAKEVAEAIDVISALADIPEDDEASSADIAKAVSGVALAGPRALLTETQSLISHVLNLPVNLVGVVMQATKGTAQVAKGDAPAKDAIDKAAKNNGYATVKDMVTWWANADKKTVKADASEPTQKAVPAPEMPDPLLIEPTGVDIAKVDPDNIPYIE